MINQRLKKLFEQKVKIEKRKKLLSFDEFIIIKKMNKIICQCKHYSYDEGSFEEYCEFYKGEYFHSSKCVGCPRFEEKSRNRKIGD